MAVEQVSDWRVVNFPAVPVPGRRYNKKGASETRYRPALTDSAGNLIQLDAPTVLELTNALALKQDLIAAGTTAQYWRGDKTWQALDKAAVGLG
ncbi:MAG TPA: hypothetical protein VGN64_23205, partial [Dyadobacter sp.]|nr:hypothetical protein [Dyadobacter sp.]